LCAKKKSFPIRSNTSHRRCETLVVDVNFSVGVAHEFSLSYVQLSDWGTLHRHHVGASRLTKAEKLGIEVVTKA
jgi:hypothetical protein